MIDEIQAALRNEQPFAVAGEERLASCFAVTDLAAASTGAVGSAVASLVAGLGLSSTTPGVSADRRLASLWFARSIHPVGWEMPPGWDPIAGDYEASDGWIRLHTNLPHHRRAALSVLGCGASREAVAEAVRRWRIDELEAAIVAAGGVAAAMRSIEDWRAHPQGAAVGAEPLIAWKTARVGSVRPWLAMRDRPLLGLRVLDLTRVLAGPVATRTLAGFGAEVLRIDPPGWEEDNVVPDITLGKRCAHLRIDEPIGRARFEALLGEADILVHGYRPDALDRLGYGTAARRRIAPDCIEVALDAYGWTGPWAMRRGFDSLVQMSSGIAEAGMRWAGKSRPTPLPVQALDHATGYLMAAAAIRALADSVAGKGITSAKLSLARFAELLMAHRQSEPGELGLLPGIDDLARVIEQTPWGPAERLRPPVTIEGTPMHWSRPACRLGSADAVWE